MRLTARKLVISLLILAQGIVLWQGAFAAGLLQQNAVDTENPVCHHTPVSDRTQLNATQTHDGRDCCDKGCIGFCNCDYCACSIGLISLCLAISFSIAVLNRTAFPACLDGQPARLLKPPRNLRS